MPSAFSGASCEGDLRFTWTVWVVATVNRTVLVLNQNYEPLNICNGRRAIVLVIGGKAEILETHQTSIATPVSTYPYPSVIRLIYLIRSPRARVKLTRREVFMRDHFTCQYCGRRSHDLTLDHVVPRSRGGKHVWENLTSACKSCNHRKGGKSVGEARMTLKRQPFEPRPGRYYSIQRRLETGFHEAWNKFLPGLDVDAYNYSDSIPQMTRRLNSPSKRERGEFPGVRRSRQRARKGVYNEMLDIRLIRDDPDRVKAALVDLNATAPIDEIIAADALRRDLVNRVEQMKARRNEGSKMVSKALDNDQRQRLIVEMRELGDEIAAIDGHLRETDEQLYGLMLMVPNLPLPDVPVGKDETENIVVRETGAIRAFDFPVIPHWDLGERLGIIDFERGVKVSGTRFYVLRGDGARLQRALITWMLDLHTRKHGYQEVYPPYLVLGQSLTGTGSLPKFAETLFRDITDDKWLIPTAEVPVTNLYRDEILDESLLPIYHTAYTACFRREQISAGKDVRGIKRGYQFDKVEMVKFVHPDQSIAEHQQLVSEAEEVLSELGLPYRLLQMCTGDLSFTAASKFDLEVWAPGSEEWLEVSSCSNFLDFQARRADIRFRPLDGGRPQFLHTLNGSGLALPRTMIAIMENYQNADGSFAVPEVLQPYLGGQKSIEIQPPIGPARR